MNNKSTMKMREEPQMVSVTPLRDFTIHQNDIHIELKEGVPCDVPLRYVINLKTEKVIKE